MTENNLHDSELAERYWKGRELSYKYFDQFYDLIPRHSDFIFWNKVWIFSVQDRRYAPENNFHDFGSSILFEIKKLNSRNVPKQQNGKINCTILCYDIQWKFSAAV